MTSTPTSIETQWTDDFEQELRRRFRVEPRRLTGQNDFDAAILTACAAWPKADPLVVKSLLAQASAFDASAHDHLGFAGVAMLGASEARAAGLDTGASPEQTDDHRHGLAPYPTDALDRAGDERFDPAKAIIALVRHLAELAEALDTIAFGRFGAPDDDGALRFVLVAHYAGPLRVAQWIERRYPNGAEGGPRFVDLTGPYAEYADAIVARARQPITVDAQPATESSTELLATEHSALTSLDPDAALVSSTLGTVERLVRLARGDATMIARDDPDPVAVAAVQRALRSRGYALGGFGPARDGIDGTFGAATEAAVRAFQSDHSDAIHGARAQDDPPEGAVDRATLIALDRDLEERDAEAPLPAAPPPATAALDHEVTFDARSGKLSVQFGLRMYQAMLAWSWVVRDDGATEGVGFSTTTPSDYGTYLPNRCRPEWPDLSGLVEPAAFEAIGGRRVPVYRFGTRWRGTHFTNGTNSQCAALFVAAGARALSVRTRGGGLTRYAFDGDATIQVRRDPDGEAEARDALSVFVETFVLATRYFDAHGNDLWIAGAEGSPSAIAALQLGAVVQPRTKSPKALQELRIGDAVNSLYHAFLVGDVRYGIWLDDDRKSPSYILDQSAFIDADPEPVVTNGKLALRVRGRAPLTHEEADWIADNESTFEARLQRFLRADTLTIDDEERSVRIVPAGVRMFAANGSRHAVHGAVRGTREPVARYGVTQPWTPLSSPLAWARFYALE